MSDEELNIDFESMSDDELLEFKAKIDSAYDEVCEKRAQELADLGEYFDAYSFSGERKIKKIAEKYKEADDGYGFLLEAVLEEMKKRNMQIDDEEFEGKQEDAELTDQEYLQREIKRNEKYYKK